MPRERESRTPFQGSSPGNPGPGPSSAFPVSRMLVASPLWASVPSSAKWEEHPQSGHCWSSHCGWLDSNFSSRPLLPSRVLQHPAPP